MKTVLFVITTICLNCLNVGCQNNQTPKPDEQVKTKANESGYSIQLTRLGPTFFSEDDFVYDIDSRFQADITKSQLKKMRLISDFDDRINIDNIVEIQSTSVTILNDDYEDVKQVLGKSNQLNDAQIELLTSAPYSEDIRIRMDYLEKSEFHKTPQHNYTTPHITIIPEKSAEYEKGKEGLIKYLKRHSRAEVLKTQGYTLEPGKVRFTVSENGKVKEVLLISTCGHKFVDEKMVELIEALPETWMPAKDASGSNVEEQLVFSFGIIGC